MSEKRCEVCQAPFEVVVQVGRKRKYCSPVCAGAASRMAAPKVVGVKHPVGAELMGQCAECGSGFSYVKTKTGPAPKTCSDQCRAARNKATANVSAMQNAKIIKCESCGTGSISRRRAGGVFARFCSIKCSNEPRRMYEDHLARRRAQEHRRRVKVKEAGVERFSDIEIFERDGWKCGLCGDPVDRTLKMPHPMCVSLDHILPIYHGGGHTRANVQCAHWLCNSRKSYMICEAVG